MKISVNLAGLGTALSLLVGVLVPWQGLRAQPAPESAPTATAVTESVPSPPAVSRPPIVGKIEEVQLPALLERGGIKAAVKPGWAIYPGDKLSTGPEGRLRLRLADDASFKMGRDSELRLAPTPLGYDPEVQTAEDSFIHISRGTFSYTAPLAPAPGHGPMTMTLGDRLTFTPLAGQLMAKSDDQEDVLLLLDGAVVVGGGPPFTMDQPESVLVQPRGLPRQAAAALPRERLAGWLAETELDRKRPVLKPDGAWSVSVFADSKASPPLVEMACRLQSQGYPTEVVSAKVKGKLWKRVMIRRFATREDAQQFTRTADSLGAAGAWTVGREP